MRYLDRIVRHYQRIPSPNDDLFMPQNSAYRFSGIFYCLFGLLLFAIQDTIVKHLSAEYPVLQLLALRTYVVLIALTVLIVVMPGVSGFSTRQPGKLLIRGVAAFCAFTTYYLALTKMPLADAATIYMTAPLFVTALSVPFLGEKVGWHRWGAVITGFMAAVFMINPGSEVFSMVAILPLFSALAYAIIPIINRNVGMSEHALIIAFYAMIAYAAGATLAAIAVHLTPAPVTSDNLLNAGLLDNLRQHWVRPDLPDSLLIALSGGVFIVGLLCLTQAYRTLPVSVVAPFEYSYILWGTLLGFIVFSELPGMRTAIGAVVIVVSGCYISWRARTKT